MSSETPQPPPQTTPSDASLAQMTPLSVSEKARLRRELRKQKVGQGADRLKRITQTQRAGGEWAGDDDEVPVAPSVGSTPARAGAGNATSPYISEVHDDDPEEVDISQHYYEPKTQRRQAPTSRPSTSNQNEFMLDNDQLAQMMMFGGGAPPPGGPGGPGGSGGFAGPPGGMPPQGFDPNADPMMMLMQQMLGGGGAGGPGGPGGPGAAGFPPGMGGPDGIPPDLLNAMLSGGMNGAPEGPLPEDSPYAKWFVIIHFLGSVLLGLFAVWSMGGRWSGTKLEREMYGEQAKIPLMWYFATMQLILQSTRYVLVERGGPPPGMIFSMVVRFLPPYIGKTLLTLSHYFKIFSIVWTDFMVLVFTIGMGSWVNSWFKDPRSEIEL